MSDYEYEGVKYPEVLMYWIDARDEIAGNIPDGAWEAFCKEGVRDYNEEHGTAYDEHGAWMAWVNWQDELGSGGHER